MYWNKLASSRINIEFWRWSVSREFTIVIERDEDGYFVGTAPQLKGCHTQAKTLDELMDRMKEAVQLCLDVEGV
jgi:predicted RNase H-like HicB family nuclease